MAEEGNFSKEFTPAKWLKFTRIFLHSGITGDHIPIRSREDLPDKKISRSGGMFALEIVDYLNRK